MILADLLKKSSGILNYIKLINIGPQQEIDFELTVCGSRAGKICHTLLCHVQHLAEPLTFYVEAEIKVAVRGLDH